MINIENAINSKLAAAQIRDTLSTSNRILIPDFLNQEIAEQLFNCLEQQVPWEMVYRENQENKVLSPQLLNGATEAELEALAGKIAEHAQQKGYQFCFDRYPMLDEYLKGSQQSPLLNSFLDYANSPQFLSFCHAITGDTEIRKVELQATRYRSGSFLRKHDDHAEVKDDRRYACVLGLTREWPSDWGGILQFVEQDTITESFHPLFNSMAIFKVPQEHQVSFVASYATGFRYALTGWMRAD
ncbi:MAG: 2OG-Fe(II) oxygenase family protein [Pseudomonadales bacterium]